MQLFEKLKSQGAKKTKKHLNIEKMALKIVQIKSLGMHITNNKPNYLIYLQ